jgi:hypothetical protein
MERQIAPLPTTAAKAAIDLIEEENRMWMNSHDPLDARLGSVL